jgi:8-oxo-dGTP diphosphatase
MQKRLASLFAALWRKINGTYLWYAIWAFSARFFIDVHGAVYDEAGRVLLVRTRLGEEGLWSLPGGIVKRGETWEEAFRREVREETACQIGEIRLLRVNSGYKLRVEAFFAARSLGGALTPDPWEVLEVRFFTLDALPERLQPNHRELLLLT